jgi:hypothetical protein
MMRCSARNRQMTEQTQAGFSAQSDLRAIVSSIECFPRLRTEICRGERASLKGKNCYLVVILFDFIATIKFESATIQAEGF